MSHIGWREISVQRVKTLSPFVIQLTRKLWWHIARELGLLLIGIFFEVEFILTYYGLSDRLSTNGDSKDVFTTLVATIGTMVAIFFSLLLIPLNQVSSKYFLDFWRT